jgi:hypothetical protein
MSQLIALLWPFVMGSGMRAGSLPGPDGAFASSPTQSDCGRNPMGPPGARPTPDM